MSERIPEDEDLAIPRHYFGIGARWIAMTEMATRHPTMSPYAGQAVHLGVVEEIEKYELDPTYLIAALCLLAQEPGYLDIPAEDHQQRLSHLKGIAEAFGDPATLEQMSKDVLEGVEGFLREQR